MGLILVVYDMNGYIRIIIRPPAAYTLAKAAGAAGSEGTRPGALASTWTWRVYTRSGHTRQILIPFVYISWDDNTHTCHRPRRPATVAVYIWALLYT